MAASARTPLRAPRTLAPQGSAMNLFGSPSKSPLRSPGTTIASGFESNGSRHILGGWRVLREAIKEGAFQRGPWKSGSNLADPSSEGLWSGAAKTGPAKQQIPLQEKELPVDKLFGQHVGIWFVIGEAFAKGGFGEVRYGYHKSMSAKKFAVKIESVNHSGVRHLSAEYNIYSILGDAPGIPRCYYYGLCGILHNALVMDLLGPSLDDVFESMKRKFSHRTVIMIALQTFDRLQYLHSRGVVHGDIKGENFLTGLPQDGSDTVIYIVDFGLSQVLKDHSKNVYLYHENTVTFPAGTPRYMSISAHNGNALSFRDDLESLCYVLIYFLRGRLPWQGIHEKNTSKKSAIIKQRKLDETAESLCASLPDEFAQLLTYSRSLRFHEEPDYDHLRQMFRDLLERTEPDPDRPANSFDWVGKTFSFRKEPSRHPILPRAEFQKKTSDPSLLPDAQLKHLNSRHSSAQLAVKSARSERHPRGSPKRMPSTPRIDPLPSVVSSDDAIDSDSKPPSKKLEVPDARPALVRASNAEIYVKPTKPPSFPLSANDSLSGVISPSDPIIDVAKLNKDNKELKENKEENSVRGPRSRVAAHALMSARSKELKNHQALLSSEGITSDSGKGETESALTVTGETPRNILAPLRTVLAVSPRPINTGTGKPVSPLSSYSFKFPPRLKLSRSSLTSSEESSTDEGDRVPSEDKSHLLITSAELSGGSSNGGWSTTAQEFVNSSTAPPTASTGFRGSRTNLSRPFSARKSANTIDGKDVEKGDAKVDGDSDQSSSVSPPEITLSPPEDQELTKRKDVVLPRSSLKPSTDTARKPVTAQPTPGSPLKANHQHVTFDKTLNRIASQDIKVNAESVMSPRGGCFSWIKRRSLCGQRKSMSDSNVKLKMG